MPVNGAGASANPVSVEDRRDRVDYHSVAGTQNGLTKMITDPEAGAVSKFVEAHLPNATNEASDRLPENACSSVTCLSKINNTRYLNKHFEAINRALVTGGTYTGCVETYSQFRHRLARQYPAVIRIPFYIIHFIFKRFLPKWGGTRRLYWVLTKGKKRVISLTEVLGRLISCGFEVADYREENGLIYYTARKVKQPDFNKDPTYGSTVRLRRIGQHGRPVTIYKFRTMHPYSEYLQDYIYRWNDLKDGGKFGSDMRITGWGRIMRRLWLDEIPMIWNLLRGDLKLVGVRPLSPQYFSLYPKEMQEFRVLFKPGLIPPYYRDMPVTLEEIVASERAYLEAWQKEPLRTDIRYFFGVLYNIVFRRVRSS